MLSNALSSQTIMFLPSSVGLRAPKPEQRRSFEKRKKKSKRRGSENKQQVQEYSRASAPRDVFMYAVPFTLSNPRLRCLRATRTEIRRVP